MANFLGKAYALYQQRKALVPFTDLEESLWQAALSTQHGGTIIGRAGDPYLLRAYLLPQRREDTPEGMPGVYLHYFFRGDVDENPHNHPFDWSITRILTSGYVEYRYHPSQKKWGVHDRRAGDSFYINSDDYHRIELTEPDRGCWTLFTAGPRVKTSDGTDWGFWDLKKHQHMHWGEYALGDEP